MNKLIRITGIFLIVPVLLVLTSCASEGSQFKAYSKTKGQKAIVANMGIPRTEYFSNKLGGGLGLVGAVIEAAATKNTSNSQTEEIDVVLARKDLTAEFGSVLRKHLAKCSFDVSQEIRVLPQSKEDWWQRDIISWRKSSTPSPDVMTARGSESLAFEVAVVNLVGTSRMTGEILGADVEVKIFDLTTSKLIEKITVANVAIDAIELKNFGADKDKKHAELVTAQEKSFDQLALSLGKKLCDV
jgi:hypothetical protein